MKVTALKQQIKNPERASIFIEGKYSFSLTLDQLLEAKLKVGQDLEESVIAELKKKSADGKLRAKAMNWVFLRPRSTKELRDYLKRVTYQAKKSAEKMTASEDVTQAIIDEFMRRGWVDDVVFATWWVGRSTRKTRSVSFLRFELMSKGIDREIISELLEQTDEAKVLEELVASLAQKSKYKDREKLKRYLVAKGFSYSSVMTALADGMDESED